MHKMGTRFLLMVIALAVPASVFARAPMIGSAERSAILEALRPAIEAKIGTDIQFVVGDMRVEQGWALVLAKPQRKSGRQIDWRRYYDAAEWEHMDGLDVSAVLRFKNRRWNLIDHAIGATDAWYCGLHAAPVSFLNC